jgi:hypothetical protein
MCYLTRALTLPRKDLLMTRSLTKAEARAFRARWQRVNAREEEELRSTSMEVKWQQFNTLLAWAHRLGWADALGEGEAEVRQRWAQLRKACRG